MQVKYGALSKLKFLFKLGSFNKEAPPVTTMARTGTLKVLTQYEARIQYDNPMTAEIMHV